MLSIFAILWSTMINSQIISEKSFFSNLKVSYNVSSQTPGGRHFIRHESLLPYGVGLETSVFSFKQFSFNLGFEYRSSGNQSFDGVVSHYGSGFFHEEDLRQYFDISCYISYMILNKSFFNLQLMAGTKTTFEKSRYLTIIDEERVIKYNTQNAGIDFGIVETFKLTDKIYFFTGQFRNQYIGKFHYLRTIDLKAGFEIKLK
jgi:hypothetical protein